MQPLLPDWSPLPGHHHAGDERPEVLAGRVRVVVEGATRTYRADESSTPVHPIPKRDPGDHADDRPDDRADHDHHAEMNLTVSATIAPPADDRIARLLVHPGDAAWDHARAAWNLAVDQRPTAVAHPETPEDVVALVAHAKAHGLRLAPQGTGHNASAIASLDGTLLVTTSRMREVVIDPIARIARIGAGVLWEEVAAAAHEHGLAALSGSSPDVGAVGYTLGGGVSWLAGAYGLSCNHVRAIEVVTADGRLVRATRDDEPELFWALRGGGSFGIVTAMELELFPGPPPLAPSSEANRFAPVVDLEGTEPELHGCLRSPIRAFWAGRRRGPPSTGRVRREVGPPLPWLGDRAPAPREKVPAGCPRGRREGVGAGYLRCDEAAHVSPAADRPR